ncbi:arginine deiminase type-3 [Ophiocordyceps sinensis CO18]|uniref:Arginine deiminase type-3 n=1 Tax=Ophiocordyceps sinensis (strain Co18 / CGMCC 3.14243) TaxID=911162 RepID=T5AN52_OPHSC|nr:arginine deiminase type-3 [Ophiocordyceps sinensis CO18]
MSLYRTTPNPGLGDSATGSIVVADATARSKVRLFHKTGGQWTFVASNYTFKAQDLKAGLELGIDARDVRSPGGWDGRATVELKIKDGETEASDSVALRVAPVLTQHHGQPAEQLVTASAHDWNEGMARFVEELGEMSRTAELKPLRIMDTFPCRGGGDGWVQDFFEAGYSSMPGPDGPVGLQIMMRSAQTQRQPGRKIFQDLRSNTQAHDVPGQRQRPGNASEEDVGTKVPEAGMPPGESEQQPANMTEKVQQRCSAQPEAVPGMPLQLYIPPCLRDPAHHLHLPEFGQPLRIQIEGPVVAIERLFPTITWHTNPTRLEFPQPAAQELANLAYRTIYGKEPRLGDAVVKDEYLGWVVENPMTRVDYYGVTFDHHVPTGDSDPEVLQINVIEVEDDDGAYANRWLPFQVDASTYRGQSVLAVPRCCQKRKGTQDRRKVNESVAERENKGPERDEAN